MVTELVARGPALGVDRLSLNFAVFRSAFEDGAQDRRRAGGARLARLLLVASRWWQLESLYRSNVKYRPEWVPRFLCFADRRELVEISFASALAEGFILLPGSSRSLATAGGAAPHPGVAGSVPVPRPPVEPERVTDPAAATVAAAVAALPQQVRDRFATLERLRAAGSVYPVDVSPHPHLRRGPRAAPGRAAREGTGVVAGVAGRIVAVRDHGRVCFAVLRDWSGDLQVLLESSRLGQDGLDRFAPRRRPRRPRRRHRRGGRLAPRRVVRGGEPWTLTSKCLRPLPDKHAGLTDPEARVRQRYLDLVLRPQARELLTARSRAVTSLRTSLVSRGFLEVETPQLQPVHGGATARPFVTHMPPTT